MVKKAVLYVLMVLSMAIPVFAAEVPKTNGSVNELDKPYTLTRKDWLELSVPRWLQNELSTWSQKTEYGIAIRETTVEVMLRCSSNSAACKFYVQESSDALKNHLEDYLKRYDWARSLKVVIVLE